MSKVPSCRPSGALPLPVPPEMTDAVTFAETLIEDVAVRRRQIEHLLADRAQRSRVDHALGILMHRYRMDAFTASQTLQRWSHVLDRPLGTRSVARRP